MLRCKQQAVSEEAGSAVERTFGADACELWEIVAFRQVPQDYVSGLTIVFGFQISRASLIGEVADSREDALLDGPGIRPVAEHFKIVVGL